MHALPDARRTAHLSTEELRASFLVQGLFVDGRITLRHVDLDRVVLGGAVPMTEPLRLEAPASLAASYFAERREVGVLNIGGSGAIAVDGQRYDMASRDVLYIGRGCREILFESDDSAAAARFYVVSYPAHASHPAMHLPADAADATELGSTDRANRRSLAKYIHPALVPSAQLLLGVTTLASAACGTRCRRTRTRGAPRSISTSISPATPSSSTSWARRTKRGI